MSMKDFAAPLFLLLWLLLVLPGCSESTELTESTLNALASSVIVGDIFYRERIALPPGATLVVTLEDVSRMDVASTVLSEHIQVLTGSTPYSFEVAYDPALIEGRMRYSLRARILVEGRLRFTSTQAIDPFADPDKPLSILLTATTAVRETAQPSTTTAEAIDGHVIVSVNPLATIEGTYWKLLSIEGREIIMSDKQEREASFQLRAGIGQAKGFGGCNSFTSGYMLNGNELSFTPMAATMRACTSGMEVEQAFFEVLENTAYFSITEESLTLFSANKQTIARFAAIYF
jgi:putative lipoprotein